MTQEEALKILKMGYNVFLTGAPGAGKTFLLNQYINFLKSHGKKVAVTASTGIAATHMNGVTLHSWSGLGIKETITDSEIRSLIKKPYLRKNIKKADVLIIDEISMLKPGQFEAVDRICQYMRLSFAPFGGLQVVCSGDFFQLPPITKYDEEVKFVVDSGTWKAMDMKVCYLHEQFRQKDTSLSDLLATMRDNRPQESRDLLARYATNNKVPGKVATKLYTHNVDVDAINEAELAKINTPEFIFYMAANGHKDVVQALKRSCLAPERLVLKTGAHVMFIKNNFEAGYVNGTQGIVTGFFDDQTPQVTTLAGHVVPVKMANWTIEEPFDPAQGKDPKILAEIKQLPLRLAWAITVHKSQGMNLDAAEIDLSKCFVEGMGYVALSRLSSLGGLKLLGVNDTAFMVHEKAVEVDEKFREDSAAAQIFLQNVSSQDRERRERQFLKVSLG